MDNLYSIVQTTIDTGFHELKFFRDHINACFTDLKGDFSSYETDGYDANILLDNRLRQAPIQAHRGGVALQLNIIRLGEYMPLALLCISNMLEGRSEKYSAWVARISDKMLVKKDLGRELFAYKRFLAEELKYRMMPADGLNLLQLDYELRKYEAGKKTHKSLSEMRRD